MGPPMVEGDLRAAVEALLAGTASRAQHHLVRETLAAGHFAQAPGERAVSVGGNADGAIISTGNDAAIFSMVRPDPEAVRQAVASVFKTRLHQLPPDLADFTGREREADELVALLGRDASGAIISAVGGMGGVGKSALAIHVAHQLTGRYPDGQLFLELGGTSERTLPPAEAMARVIRSFEPAAHLPDDEGEIATIYRSTLAGKRVALVLDNARDAAQVRPLVPPTGCAMIVTSRRVLALSGCTAHGAGRSQRGAGARAFGAHHRPRPGRCRDTRRNRQDVWPAANGGASGRNFPCRTSELASREVCRGAVQRATAAASPARRGRTWRST